MTDKASHERDWSQHQIARNLGKYLGGVLGMDVDSPKASATDRQEAFHNFYSPRLPPISIAAYVERIAHYLKPGAEALLQVPCHLQLLHEV